jgi:Arc/MetJ-type ribon-helix-helix transcriptional regulator
VSTTTVRLDQDDERILDKLAPSFGGRSNAIRAALRSLAEDVDRNEALGVFLTEWEREAGPVNEAAVEAMARRYQL